MTTWFREEDEWTQADCDAEKKRCEERPLGGGYQCSISHPERCFHARFPGGGSWCECHYPYRCWCGAIAIHCVPYSAVNTDTDRWYCDPHYQLLPEDMQ